MVATFAIMALVGLAIGLLSGLLGVGGGTIMVPVFRLIIGMDALASTATSLFTIIPTSISGAVTHLKARTCAPLLGVSMGLGGALTSPLGVWLAQVSPSWMVMVAAALVIGYSAFTMLRKALGAKNAASSGLTESPASGEGFTGKDAAKGIGIGLITGIASGYVGLGGGFLMVPLMVSMLKLPMKLASGTSLIAIMILAIPGTVMQCMLGNVDFLAGIAVACGSIPGAIVGARLLPKIPERSLRLVFAAFLGVAAILLVVKETGLIG